jgi:type IV pilus assembly protein PilF
VQRLILACVLIVCLLIAACSKGVVREEESPATRAARANVELGVGYLKQGKRKLALEKLKKAVDLDPNLPSAQHSLALAYQQYGQPDLAEQHYKRALELAPEDGNIHNNFGTFLCSQNRVDEAEQQFGLALKDPAYETPARALENAGLCALRIPDQVKAEKYLRRALQINPKLPAALFEMAKINFDMKNYLDARAYIQRFEQVAPHTPQSLGLAVRIEQQLGDKQAEQTYMQMLKSKFPQSEEAKQLTGTGTGS